MDPDPIGTYRVRRLPFSRRLAMDAFAAVEQSHSMLALLEIDVTETQAMVARRRAAGERISLFTVVVRAVAIALSEHRELNVMSHGRDVVEFDDVDISVPVEVETAEGRFPRMVVIRRAHTKDAVAIHREIDAARERHAATGAAGAEDRWARRSMRALGWLPRPLRVAILRRFVDDPWRVKRTAGTTLVTSVGNVAEIPGFVIPFTGGPRATLFALGSAVDKPVVRDGKIEIRTMLSVTIVFNHDLVDGAPAARFARRLQELIERPEAPR
jgi:pyruvate/2-oxoglutarate dehydrogenase complex dihydrolipoamide acyltransferase (E2) component